MEIVNDEVWEEDYTDQNMFVHRGDDGGGDGDGGVAVTALRPDKSLSPTPWLLNREWG